MREQTQRRRFFYGWVVVGGAWLMYMLNQAAFTWGFSVYVKPLGDEFGWSRASITIAWALSLSWGLLVGPWFGRAFDRYGPRFLTVAGGIFGGLGWVLIPIVDNYWVFLTLFVFLVGTGINGAIGLSGSAAIAQWFRVRRSLAMGIYFTGSGGAGLLLIPLMSILITGQGWRAGAIVLGVVILLVAAVVTPFMRHRPEQYGLEPDGGTALSTASRRSHLPVGFLRRLPFPKHRVSSETNITLGEALRTPAFWMFTGAIFLRYVGMGMTQVHQVPHMLSQGLPLAVAAAALSTSLIVNIPGRVLMGWLGDIYDKRWLLNALAVVGSAALLSLALVTPALSGLVWVYAALWGIGLAMLPLQAAWLADSYGRRYYGSISSFSNSLSLSGRIVGAVGAAIAFDLLGGYQLVLLVGAAGFAVSAVLLALLPPTRAVSRSGRAALP